MVSSAPIGGMSSMHLPGTLMYSPGLSQVSKPSMLTKTSSAPPTPSADEGHLHPRTFQLPNAITTNSEAADSTPATTTISTTATAATTPLHQQQ
jgi:hypothetical protein